MDERELEKLIETHLLTDLDLAEQALINGKSAKIELPGANPAEKMAAIAAAKWIVEKIRVERCDFKTAFEAYQKVIKDSNNE